MPTKVKSQKLKVKSSPRKTRGPASLRPAGARSSLSASRTERTARRSRALPRVTPRAEKTSLSASVYDLKGKAVGRVSLPSEIFAVSDNPKLISQAVRVYLANQRMGTASTKTRGEVRGSTRKIYKQKGTGRARHGGIRAPIFVHGGIAHGPRPRDYSLTLPAKMKKLAMFSALSGKLRDGEIKVLETEKISPKTKVFAKALNSLDLKGKVLLVTPGGIKENKNLYLSARNIPAVRILTASTLNTYDVLNNNAILFIKDSIDVLKKHFLERSSR